MFEPPDQRQDRSSIKSSIKTIVCPLDFSFHSEQALSFALELARPLGATVAALHVYHLPFYAPPHQPADAARAMAETYREQGREELDALLALPQHLESGVQITGNVAEGRPHEEICRFADERGADLIVMGTHGRTGLARVLLGSVTERVIRTTAVPVLAVPAPGAGA